MKHNPTRALAVAAGLVIVALTAAAFWLSYAHLAEVALAHGMHDKEVRAWAWPATLDLFIVAGELLMLRAALKGAVDWWAICLTVAGSGGSIALNVAGVGGNAELLDYVVAAVPPTAALLAFGALMRQIHQALAGRAKGYASVPTPGGEQPAEVIVERVDDDEPLPALEPRPVLEVVPAGVRMLPIVARQDDQQQPPAEPPRVVIPSVPELESGVFWDALKASDLNCKRKASVPAATARQVTTAVPAETPREVVTQVVALTPSELRRRASKLNRELVTSTGRPVTIERLREEYGLSRREATELRREVVTVALVPGEARP